MSRVVFTAYAVWIRLNWAVVSVEIFLNQNVFCGGILIRTRKIPYSMESENLFASATNLKAPILLNFFKFLYN